MTHSGPKQLVPVAGRPVLLHCLDAIRDAGITNVGIVVGSRSGAIIDALGDGMRYGVRLTYIHQAEPLGLAHCVLIARDFPGDDDFVVYLGDNIVVDGIAEAIEQFRAQRPDALLMVAKVADSSGYDVAEIGAGDEVVRLQAKSPEPVSDLTVMGVYVLGSAIHDAIRDIAPSARGELEITDALQWMVDTGRDVRARLYGGYWKDTGRIEDLLDCNRLLLARLEPVADGLIDEMSTAVGRVAIDASARITATKLVGPVVVGAGAVLANCHIGPNTSVGPDCRLENVSVEDSIILGGAELSGVRGLRGSVIGRDTVVRTDDPAASYRLILGDDSHVVIAGVPA